MKTKWLELEVGITTFEALERRAKQEGRSLNSVTVRALRDYLKIPPKPDSARGSGNGKRPETRR